MRSVVSSNLPFEDNQFDLIIFGFCLYLCDRDDLFLITSEANRVLKNQAWVAIFDFYSPFPYSNKYSHKEGIFSYKMDHSTMFTWHPYYNESFRSTSNFRNNNGHTDDVDEMISSIIIRKNTLSFRIMHKFAAIVQARCSSSRFPDKVLAKD